jgi:hypothetical protein
MDPISVLLAVIIGGMFISGFARPAPQEPQVIYVDRREAKREEPQSGSGGLLLFIALICLAIYFFN